MSESSYTSALCSKSDQKHMCVTVLLLLLSRLTLISLPLQPDLPNTASEVISIRWKELKRDTGDLSSIGCLSKYLQPKQKAYSGCQIKIPLVGTFLAEYVRGRAEETAREGSKQ